VAWPVNRLYRLFVCSFVCFFVCWVVGWGQVATILTAVFSFIGMLVSGWGEQVDSVQGSDAPIYIVFGMYIPVVLVLFSLAPRFIATAEMGCIKQLETLCTPFWVYLYDGTARKKAVFSAQKNLHEDRSLFAKTGSGQAQGNSKALALFLQARRLTELRTLAVQSLSPR
jgi:hypothetical protein